jgi:hypothetical protein
MEEAEDDVLAYMDFPPAHWVKLHSTNPIERPRTVFPLSKKKPSR